MNDLPELIKLIDSPHAISFYFVLVLLFGFAPGFTLRLLVKIYPADDDRRKVLLAEMYELPRRERWFFVAQQLETVLVEGLPARIQRWRTGSPVHQAATERAQLDAAKLMAAMKTEDGRLNMPRIRDTLVESGFDQHSATTILERWVATQLQEL